MPVLHLSVADVVEALGRRFGADRIALVEYAPDARVVRLFASQPALATPKAEALGLRHDGSADALVERALS
jgi:D-erythronate 2-dehydrogenase